MIGPIDGNGNGNGHSNGEGPRRTRSGLPAYNERIVERIYKLVSSGLTYSQAAQRIGIRKSTISEWKRAHPEFLALMEKADCCFIQKNLAIIQKAAPRTWQAAAWLLERKFPENFAKREVQLHKFDDAEKEELTADEKIARLRGIFGANV